MKWSENDKLFKKELEAGYKWQLYVAKYLEKCGLEVDVPSLSFRDHIKNAAEYSDLEDIYCGDRIFEVKSRKLRFTCPNDFPYDTILVDTVKGWEAKNRKPDAYICVSTFTGKMIVLSSNTHSDWIKVQRYDATRHIQDWFYECPKDKWRRIEALVKRMKQ